MYSPDSCRATFSEPQRRYLEVLVVDLDATLSVKRTATAGTLVSLPRHDFIALGKRYAVVAQEIRVLGLVRHGLGVKEKRTDVSGSRVFFRVLQNGAFEFFADRRQMTPKFGTARNVVSRVVED